MEMLNELHWKPWFSIEKSSLYTVAENSLYLCVIYISSSFSQYLMRYYFSREVYAMYWTCLIITKMKPCLKFLETSGGNSPLINVPTLNRIQCGLYFSIDNLLHILPTWCELSFSILCRGPCHWDETHSRANKWVRRQISQSLHPIVSHLKWISMGHISMIHEGFLKWEAELLDALSFWLVNYPAGKSTTRRKEIHKNLCSLQSSQRQHSLQFFFNIFPHTFFPLFALVCSDPHTFWGSKKHNF